MITQIDEALEKRELIKITLLQNTDEVAEEVAEELTAAIHLRCGTNYWSRVGLIQAIK